MRDRSCKDLTDLFGKLRRNGRRRIGIECADPAGLACEIRLLYDAEDYSSYCTEEKDCCFFDFSSLPTPCDRFELYRDPGEFMTQRRFLKITGGAGATHTFRALMREVEREFVITERTAHSAVLRSYLYFLRTALFWDRIGKIRDPRYEPLPLVVLNAPKEILENKGLLIKTERQKILIN